MKKEGIISLPDKNLRRKSKKIHAVSNQVRQVIKQMASATLDWEDSRKHETGVALAAVQINKLERVLIIREDFEDKANRSFTAFINPKIVKYSGSKKTDFEGCLSVPDIYGKVPRYQKIEVEALNIKGMPVKVTAEGFLARVFQHEIDHMEGRLFIDLIKGKPDAFYRIKPDGKLEELNYEKDVQKNPVLW